MIAIFRRRKLRPIQQMEAAECGVASLAVVLDYYGGSIPLEELREVCGTSRDGNSALDLVRAAQELGLDAAGYRLDVGDLDRQELPLILHWRMNHFVVLERVKRGRVSLIDPASGRVQATFEEVDRCFSGVALAFRPTKRLRRRRNSPGFSRYFRNLRTATGAVFFILVAGGIAQLLGVLAPSIQQILVDQVIAPSRRHWLLPILSIQVAAVVLSLWLRWLSQTFLMRFQLSLAHKLTEQLGRRLLRLPLVFIESRSRGDLVQRVASHAQLGDLLTATTSGLMSLFFVAGLAVLMAAYDFRLAAIVLGIDAVRIVLLRHLREDTRQRAAGEIAARASETSIVLQAASAGETIQAFGIELGLYEWYLQRLSTRLDWSVRSARLALGASSFLAAFDSLAHAAVLWCGGGFVIQGQMSLGVFAGFLAIRSLLRGPLGSVVGTLESWMEFRSTLTRTDEVLRQPEHEVGDVDAAGLSPELELRNVGFRYSSGSPWLFRGMNLRIPAGQAVTLVGPSGQGKSSLLRLLAGIVHPTEGEVLLGGVSLRDLSPASLAKVLGVVVGKPVILEGTVRENLCLRVPGASDEEVRRAARIACFDEVVAKMPGGYSTRLSATHCSLSGGEQQRLGLAQALLGSPRILLLDEATCFLDQETEARVLENLSRANMAAISVAHREAVIRGSRNSFRVEGGAITRMATGGDSVPQGEREPRPVAAPSSIVAA